MSTRRVKTVDALFIVTALGAGVALYAMHKSDKSEMAAPPVVADNGLLKPVEAGEIIRRSTVDFAVDNGYEKKETKQFVDMTPTKVVEKRFTATGRLDVHEPTSRMLIELCKQQGIYFPDGLALTERNWILADKMFRDWNEATHDLQMQMGHQRRVMIEGGGTQVKKFARTPYGGKLMKAEIKKAEKFGLQYSISGTKLERVLTIYQEMPSAKLKELASQKNVSLQALVNEWAALAISDGNRVVVRKEKDK